MDLSVNARLSVQEGLPEAWEQLLPPEPPRHLRRRWLSFAVRRMPGELLALSIPGATTVGALVRTPTGRRFNDPYLLLAEGCPEHQDRSERPWENLAESEVLPSLALTTPEYAFAASGDAGSVAALLTQTEDWARGQGAQTLVVLYVPEASLSAAFLREAGYQSAVLAERCFLDVTWVDFEGYLGSLSASRRQSARRELRQHDAAGLVEQHRFLRPHEPALVELLVRHAERHGTPLDQKGAESLLHELCAHFGPRNLDVFEVCTGEGTVVNFATFAREGSELVCLLTGTDYDRDDARDCYFRTMFYMPAAQAFDMGIASIDYGIGATETKVGRGCRSVVMLSFRKHLQDRA